MTFLYPISLQFAPVDGVVANIVKELESRKWQVPCIKVEFASARTYSWVREIKAADWRLTFGRSQGQLGQDFDDTSAVSEICIPKFEISLFPDESGPHLFTYVGTDWDADKDWWLESQKWSSKLKGEARRCLLYRGSNATTYHVDGSGQRPRYLLHDSDLGREYEIQGDESKYFTTSEVFQQTADWLTVNILTPLQAQR